MKFKKDISNDKMLSHEMRCFINIIFFHYNGMIDHNKFAGMMSALRNGTLVKFRNTYKCSINNTWYRDSSMSDILNDVWITSDVVPTKTDMDFETMLMYINKYLSKPRNYCIDYLFTEIVCPIVYNNTYDIYSRLFGINIKDYNNKPIGDIIGLGSGHCCDDCDGSYSEYLKNAYDNQIKPSNHKALNDFMYEYFYNMRDNNRTVTNNKFKIYA
jgi:hypothetical protein